MQLYADPKTMSIVVHDVDADAWWIVPPERGGWLLRSSFKVLPSNRNARLRRYPRHRVESLADYLGIPRPAPLPKPVRPERQLTPATAAELRDRRNRQLTRQRIRDREQIAAARRAAYEIEQRHELGW